MRIAATLLSIFFVCSGGHAEPSQGQVASLVVVVNASNSKSDLTSDELLAYFKMDQQWWPRPNRKPATLVLRGTRSTETRALLQRVYKMSATELRKYWVAKVFRGEIGRKPEVVTKTSDVLARIARDAGAFSVVRADEVNGRVRQLTIDGKKPGDKGYLLDVQLR